MRLLLAGGGTGGHVFPAVALAEQLLIEEPGAQVLFVGTRKGLEARVIPELGYRLETIGMSGFVGKGFLSKLAVIPRMFRSIVQSSKILRTFRPDVVVGVGGYASAPVLLAAKLAGVPVLIHEQNARAGLTNRLLATLASRVCLSFEQTEGLSGPRTLLTGNPLRRALLHCPTLPSSDSNLLVFGGSLGARAINDAMFEALELLEPWKGRLSIVHQTGEKDWERIREGYRKRGWTDARVVPFIEDMGSCYAQAHLVLCRAGATTIAELTSCGRGSVLIPFPHAAGDHQTANALALARSGAALNLSQTELTPGRLAAMLGALLEDRGTLEAMASAAWSQGRRGAAEVIIEECRKLARKAV